MYLLVDPGLYPLPLNFLNLFFLIEALRFIPPIGWTPVTDTTDKETNERTNERTDGRTEGTSVRRLLDGV